MAGLPVRPMSPLSEAQLGPVHILVRRCLDDEVTFEAPLRSRGRIPRGSNLLNAAVLRAVLTWPTVQQRPDLAVVLVDEDGAVGRRPKLESAVAGLPVVSVVGVAVREFESWLLGDIRAVSKAVHKPVAEPANIEGLKPGEAKRLLADIADGADGSAVRLEIAKTASLERLRKLRSFEAFSKGLVRAGS